MNRQEYIRLAGSFVLGITSAATVAHVMAFNNRDRPQFEYKRGITLVNESLLRKTMQSTENVTDTITASAPTTDFPK